MAQLLILRGAMGAGKSDVTKELRQRRPALKVIEIDDLKRAKYGTTEKCNPPVDFPEAGRLAKADLDDGCHTVVVEPLCEVEHLQFVLNATGRSENSPDVSIVWLDCSLETAIARKGAAYPRSVIEGQHRRYAGRYRPKGEVVIATDRVSVCEVAEAVLGIIPH